MSIVPHLSPEPTETSRVAMAAHVHRERPSRPTPMQLVRATLILLVGIVAALGAVGALGPAVDYEFGGRR